MKIKNTILLFILVSSITFAQGLKFGPTVGFTNIQSPDGFTNSIEDNGLGFSSNVHYGAKLKASLPVIPINIIGSFRYMSLSADGNKNAVGLGSINAESESSILSIGLGTEWELVPGPISPYAALDVLFTSVGETSLKSVTDLKPFEDKSGSVSRVGIGIGLGLGVKIFPKVDLDISAKYNFNTLFGREDGEENLNTLDLSANFLFSIL